jgi:CheY-like chemotaxis protein
MKTILVLDDTAEILELVGGFLERNGFDVITANSGYQALKILKHVKVDAVVSDFEMPIMDGAAFILKAREEYEKPIIVFTGAVINKVPGANAVVHKTDHKALLTMLRALTEETEAA